MGAPVPKQPFLLFVGILAVFSLSACESYPGPTSPPTVQTISGKVLELSLTAQALGAPDKEEPALPPGIPVPGAVVEMIANNVDTTDPNLKRVCDCLDGACEFRTVSDENGHFVLENVPLTYNPETAMVNSLFLRITKEGYATTYHVFPLSLGPEGDITIMSDLFVDLLSFLYSLMVGEPIPDPETRCFMMGAALGFADPYYPPVTATLAGVSAQALGGNPPEARPIIYMGEDGMPVPEATETSALGAFFFVVPDARDSSMPIIDLSGTKPGASFVGGYYPACPGGFEMVGVIDPFYEP